MKKELQIGQFILTAILENEEGRIEIIDEQNGFQEVISDITERYFVLLLTLTKLGAFEIMTNETDEDASDLANRVRGAEEMLLNVVEVLEENKYLSPSLLAVLVPKIIDEYRTVYYQVYGEDIPDDLFG